MPALMADLFTGTGVQVRDLSRLDLARLFGELGFTQGAEIGVWRGAYAKDLCRWNQGLSLLCVDPWVSYDAWVDKKNRQQYVMEDVYRDACTALAGLHCTIRRGFSKDVAPTIQDGSLDFVYIDGNHVYDAVLEDLTLWAPKVKRGGIVAGHDYRVYPKQPEIEVQRAVDAYVIAHGIDPLVVFAREKAPSFAWRVA